ncbi:MAG: 3-phosphoshikimate 1-carboxyvinyltransferase [Nitrospira bacterium HGW-Nitrospira-1]|nr:MAG: 3-phosphoshikimate 1-carboxyvinyltransferase [Nitrospira bacterium HGW-Nitrospira-1]
MDRIELNRARAFKGEFSPPPDKSISHRSVIFSSLAKGTSTVTNFLRANDTLSTINAFRSLGIDIIDEGSTLTIQGKGLRGLSEPQDVIDCGNSGTTIRLISGVLSGSPFFSVLTGDSSLRTRPMARVIKPLSLMGAHISARDNNQYPPLAIKGGDLSPIKYIMPIASAQVKSALLLAGLYAGGDTEIMEPVKSRDHSEKMLSAFGADLTVKGLGITIRGGRELGALDTHVPGDFSSAAFFIVAALLIPGAEILVRDVGINPTRTGLLTALKNMGAAIEVSNIHDVSGEPVADICCKGGSTLKAVSVTGELAPSLIDEFPILCVAAALAEGTTTIKGAGELRVKESDRIKTIATELRKMGVEINEYPDGLSIKGAEGLRGAEVESHGDHRIAMAMSIAALMAEGKTIINGASAVDISFPGFFDIIGRLSS